MLELWQGTATSGTQINAAASAGVSSFSNLGAGQYFVRCEDFNACIDTINITLANATSISFTATATQINCAGGTGSAALVATGGTGAYTYLQGTTSVTSQVTGLVAGDYTFTVTDANNGCITTATATIAPAPSAVLASAAITTPVACNGGSAVVTVSATGGVTPFTGTGTFTVSAGAYSYTVTDANGCATTVSDSVSEPTQLVASATAGTIACNGGTTTVTVSANGGTAPFTGTGTFTVSAGAYSYTVTDANGCTTAVSGTISQPTPLVASSIGGSVDCNTSSTTVNVTANGGTAPFTGTGTFTVSAGSYSYTVTDANGCTATTSGVVNTIADSTQPTIYFQAAADTIKVCSGTGVNLGTPATADNCSVASVTNNAPTTFPVGTTTVTWTVTDASGNTATANQTVIVFAPIPTTTVNVTEFFSYVIPGTTTTITTSGTYNQVYAAANTCDSTVIYNVTIKGLALCAKAFLSGPYDANTGLMTDSLRTKGLLPLSTPYGSGIYTSGYTSVNNISTETTTSAVLAVTGNNAIVDWVFVQIRSKADSSIVLGTRSALIQRDGDIVDMDGTSSLKFADFLPDNFFVSVKHRNHIGIMTANKYALSLTANCIDFTTTSTPLFVQPGKKGNPAPLTGPTRIQNGVRTLYAGNCNISTALTRRFITYNVLTTSDRNELYVVTGGTNTLNGYSVYDMDMNGFARFNGLFPDRNVILSNCAGSNNLITNEQTPN
jgi:hypothetical protein